MLEELRKLSGAINQKIDLTDITSKLDDIKLFGCSPTVGLETAGSGPVSSKSRIITEVLPFWLLINCRSVTLQ